MLSTLSRSVLPLLLACVLLCLLALGVGARVPSRQLAVVARAFDGVEEIFTVDAARRLTARLTSSGVAKSPLVWSPTGDYFAYSSGGRSADLGGLYIMAADGQSPRRLLESAVGYPPAWSPDGGQLAYVAGRGGRFHLLVLDVATGETRSLVEKDRQIAFPAWSPDGGQLAFVVVFGREDGLFVVDAATGSERHLSDKAVTAPVWSPDGREIAFTASNTGDSEVYVLDVAGGEARNVSNHPAYDADPVWSPDGAQLAFYSLRECNELSLYVVDADGANQRRLLDQCALSLRENDRRPPAWSPDGEWIAVTSQDGPALNVYAVSVLSGDITRLTDFAATVKYPAWRPAPVMGS